MNDHAAGVRLIAESIERGLDTLGKDETQMTIKRQDVEDLRAVLDENERLRAQIDVDRIGYVNVRKAKNEVIGRIEAALPIAQELSGMPHPFSAYGPKIVKALRGEK